MTRALVLVIIIIIIIIIIIMIIGEIVHYIYSIATHDICMIQYNYTKHVLSLMLTPAKTIFSHTYQDSAKINDDHINFRHHHDLRV